MWRTVALLGVLGVLAAPAACWSQSEAYLNTFELVWGKVNETYFDRTFGGLDWTDVHDRLQPRIAAARDDREFYELINDMLWELGISHASLIPPGSLARYEPLAFAKGTAGIDIRLLDGVPVITSIRSDSPAQKAGLRPGYVVEAVDGVPVEQIGREAEARMPPPSNSRSRSAWITKAVLSRVYGAPGTEVSIAYSDDAGQRKEETLTRAERAGVAVGPLFLAVEFEVRRLDDGIGYIRLNTLQPQFAARMPTAIASMGDVRGIVLDLRGNSGGETEGMPEALLRERTLMYRRRTMSGETDAFFEPANNAFKGPLVLLIDATSGSASELLAASLQAAGRAVVVGDRSPGLVVESDTMILPSGAVFVYPVAQICTPDGAVLEGRGVVPDIEVGLSREMLLQGIDSQLDAAVRYLQAEGKE